MGTVRIRPGQEELSPAQRVRIRRATAVLRAKKAAIDAGVSPADLHLYDWMADEESDDPGIVQRLGAVSDSQRLVG